MGIFLGYAKISSILGMPDIFEGYTLHSRFWGRGRAYIAKQKKNKKKEKKSTPDTHHNTSPTWGYTELLLGTVCRRWSFSFSFQLTHILVLTFPGQAWITTRNTM